MRYVDSNERIPLIRIGRSESSCCRTEVAPLSAAALRAQVYIRNLGRLFELQIAEHLADQSVYSCRWPDELGATITVGGIAANE